MEPNPLVEPNEQHRKIAEILGGQHGNGMGTTWETNGRENLTQTIEIVWAGVGTIWGKHRYSMGRNRKALKRKFGKHGLRSKFCGGEHRNGIGIEECNQSSGVDHHDKIW